MNHYFKNLRIFISDPNEGLKEIAYTREYESFKYLHEDELPSFHAKIEKVEWIHNNVQHSLSFKNSTFNICEDKLAYLSKANKILKIVHANGNELAELEAPKLKSELMLNGKLSSHPNLKYEIRPHWKIKKDWRGRLVSKEPEQARLSYLGSYPAHEHSKCLTVYVDDGGNWQEIQYLNMDTLTFLDKATWGGRTY